MNKMNRPATANVETNGFAPLQTDLIDRLSREAAQRQKEAQPAQ